jgi:hypothetical protein
MWNWILIGSLYLLGMGTFRLLGGLGAAGEAFRRWGSSVSHRERQVSPSA